MPEADNPPLLFSVIMPVYNHVRYVRQAVQSVLDQTYCDWELLITDDGSTDGSSEILREFAAADQRVRLARQDNTGLAGARKAALARARGRWLVYLDSDDVWFPQTLEHFARFVRTHPDVQFLYGYRHRFDQDGKITELAPEFQDRVTTVVDLFQRQYISHLCVCYRRDLYEKVGGYDASLRQCEDYDLYLQMGMLTDFTPLGQPTGLRRRHDANLSRQSGYSRSLEAAVLRRFLEKRGGAALVPRDIVDRRLGQLYYAAARQYFRAGCFRQAAEAAARAKRFRRSLKCTLVGLASRLLRPFGRTDGRTAQAS